MLTVHFEARLVSQSLARLEYVCCYNGSALAERETLLFVMKKLMFVPAAFAEITSYEYFC